MSDLLSDLANVIVNDDKAPDIEFYADPQGRSVQKLLGPAVLEWRPLPAFMAFPDTWLGVSVVMYGETTYDAEYAVSISKRVAEASTGGIHPLALQIALGMLDRDFASGGRTLVLALHDHITNSVIIAAYDPDEETCRFIPWRNPRPTHRIVHPTPRRTQRHTCLRRSRGRISGTSSTNLSAEEC